MLEGSCRTGDEDRLCLPGVFRNLLNPFLLVTSSLLLATIYYLAFHSPTAVHSCPPGH